MAARATIRDFVVYGLPQAALATVASVLDPVLHTGSGAGFVAPGGTLNAGALLVGSLAVVVRVVAGGLPGAATWQYSTDAGTTWSATAATPAANVPAPILTTAPGVSPPPNLPTGLTAAFAKLLVAGDTYAWGATSTVQSELDASSAYADGYLDERYVLALAAPYPRDLIAVECRLAALDILTTRGFSTDNPADVAVKQRAARAEQWLKDMRDRAISPAIVGASSPVPYVLVTGRGRGLCEE